MEGVVRRNQHSATLINDAGQLVGPTQFDLRHPLSLQCSATHRSKQPKPPWSQFGWPKSRRNAVRLIVHGRAKKAISVSMQSAPFCRFLRTKSIVIRAVLLHSISYYFDTTRFLPVRQNTSSSAAEARTRSRSRAGGATRSALLYQIGVSFGVRGMDWQKAKTLGTQIEEANGNQQIKTSVCWHKKPTTNTVRCSHRHCVDEEGNRQPIQNASIQFPQRSDANQCEKFENKRFPSVRVPFCDDSMDN